MRDPCRRYCLTEPGLDSRRHLRPRIGLSDTRFPPMAAIPMRQALLSADGPSAQLVTNTRHSALALPLGTRASHSSTNPGISRIAASRIAHSGSDPRNA